MATQESFSAFEAFCFRLGALRRTGRLRCFAPCAGRLRRIVPSKETRPPGVSLPTGAYKTFDRHVPPPFGVVQEGVTPSWPPEAFSLFPT